VEIHHGEGAARAGGSWARPLVRTNVRAESLAGSQVRPRFSEQVLQGRVAELIDRTDLAQNLLAAVWSRDINRTRLPRSRQITPITCKSKA